MSSPNSITSTPTRIASASTTPPLLLAQANICIKTNRTFRERLGEVEQLQKRCKEAALNKGDVDGWDEETRQGVTSWIDDVEVPWRCLRVSGERFKMQREVVQLTSHWQSTIASGMGSRQGFQTRPRLSRCHSHQPTPRPPYPPRHLPYSTQRRSVILHPPLSGTYGPSRSTHRCPLTPIAEKGTDKRGQG